MKNKIRRLFTLLVITCFIMTLGVFNIPAYASPSSDRIYGSNRYSTAVEISYEGWDSSEYAILARGDDFADALCAGPLAYDYDAPILLTEPSKLNSDTLDELERLDVETVIIVGGTKAVSSSVESKLESEGFDVERISGNNRYETSVEIANELDPDGEVAIATGANFPDALSISPIAASLGMPILLTEKNSLPDAVEDYIDDNDIDTAYVVGGTSVITSTVTNSLPSPIRLYGYDRYGTNVDVMTEFEDDLDFDTVYVATGNEFADALAGAVLAAKTSSPLILSDKTLSSTTTYYLSDILPSDCSIIALGGTNAVPASVINKLLTYADNDSDDNDYSYDLDDFDPEEEFDEDGTYGPSSGTDTIDGDVLISADGVKLRNTEIDGDLLISEDVDDGEVYLDNVTVTGTTYILGGGSDSIELTDCDLDEVIVDDDDDDVRVYVDGDTIVGTVTMYSGGELEESDDLGDDGFTDVIILEGASVTLTGDFDIVDIDGEDAELYVEDGNIGELNVLDGASDAYIELASDVNVEELNIDDTATIDGSGNIELAYVNVDGVEFEYLPEVTYIEDNCEVEMDGEDYDEDDSPVYRDDDDDDYDGDLTYNWDTTTTMLTVEGNCDCDYVTVRVTGTSKSDTCDTNSRDDFDILITGLTSGKDYEATIKAYDDDGRVIDSDTFSFTTDKTVAQALTSINSGNASLRDYQDAGITGVTSTTLSAVNAAIVAKKAEFHRDLTLAEIQTHISGMFKATVSTVERDPGNTGGTGASFNQSTKTFSGTIDYYEADVSLGRVAGNYVGVKITAPTGTNVVSDNATFKYTNSSGEVKTLINGTTKWLDGDYYVYYYPLVTASRRTFTIVIDWDGSGTAYAEEAITINVATSAELLTPAPTSTVSE